MNEGAVFVRRAAGMGGGVCGFSSLLCVVPESLSSLSPMVDELALAVSCDGEQLVKSARSSAAFVE